MFSMFNILRQKLLQYAYLYIIHIFGKWQTNWFCKELNIFVVQSTLRSKAEKHYGKGQGNVIRQEGIFVSFKQINTVVDLSTENIELLMNSEALFGFLLQLCCCFVFYGLICFQV